MSQSDTAKRSSRWALPVLVAAITAGCLMYRILVLHRLEQTALLFIGIPALLAVIVSLTPPAKTATGGVMKATALFLLLSAPLLGEGFICIVMASPIFFAVALVIGLVMDHRRKHARHNGLYCLVLLLTIAPMSLEGSHPSLSFHRDESVTVRRIVAGSPADVANAMRRSPRIDLPVPLFFRMGFPRPVEAHGSGLERGDTRTIHFAGGEGKPGDLVFEVIDAGPFRASFAARSDQSKIAHWLEWASAEVTWKALDPNHTEVEWTLRYRRLLDPAWYFRPWERYAVHAAADYLIQANATPEPAP
jgi:hypothetical protein